MARPAILVTGGSGQVGTALRHAARHGFEIVAPGRDMLDLCDAHSIERVMAERDWAVVINAAAYTAVDRAESEAEMAFAINAGAPAIFARETAARGVPLIQLSTDYVFDGTKAAAYREEDPVAPLGVYGASKAAGEAAVRDHNPAHVIVRTAWVLSPWGHNFVKTMLRLGAERESLSVVADQHGCPTSAIDVADALLAIAARIEGRDERFAGTYHFVNAGEATWHDLAAHIFARAGEAGRKVPGLHAIPTSAYPTPARRPANSRLATDRITGAFGIVPRDWRTAVNDILDDLLEAG